MEPRDIDEAARLLAAARKGGALLEALPAHAQPSTFAEAASVQRALLSLLGEAAAGYKLAGTTPATVMWGAILHSRTRATPATFQASLAPMLGVEPPHVSSAASRSRRSRRQPASTASMSTSNTDR